jgi:hypothetical protein
MEIDFFEKALLVNNGIAQLPRIRTPKYVNIINNRISVTQRKCNVMYTIVLY